MRVLKPQFGSAALSSQNATTAIRFYVCHWLHLSHTSNYTPFKCLQLPLRVSHEVGNLKGEAPVHLELLLLLIISVQLSRGKQKECSSRPLQRSTVPKTQITDLIKAINKAFEILYFHTHYLQVIPKIKLNISPL